ncbi:MAG: M23 family metallopeptidase [Candidatus Faecimonas sp.]|nr:M23 family metallopeptidase [Mycoplasmatota bacterium]MDY2908481.1 M23 family metallopeptidase [Candidatus Faecimonas sp.]
MNTRKYVKKKLVLKKSVRNFITRVLIVVIIFLVGMILVKSNSKAKNSILKQVYDTNFKFTKVKEIYQKYFGNILSIDKLALEDKQVFQEELTYQKSKSYLDGVKLQVNDNYMVPALESGIVIFMGEKEGYGNTIVIEQIDGIDVYYSNISSDGIKLYDYVEKGKLLGEAEDNQLYLVFQKDGSFLDYKKYI